MLHDARVTTVGLLAAATMAATVAAQSPSRIDSVHPFAAVTAAAQWRDAFSKKAEVDPKDPFHNLSPNDWWRLTWQGQWREAASKGTPFKTFWDSLQGKANNGRTADIRSPYPFTSAEEQWTAWLKAANGGTRHTRATLPDWSGDWTGGPGYPDALVRDFWTAVSDSYRPRYEQVLQAELEGRHWWPADNCRPNGFVRSGWSIRYFMTDPTMVVLSFVDPLNQDRYVFTDGRGFLPEQNAVPQWMGESQGFWDGDELVIWTRNIIQNSGGHGLPEHSDKLQLIERYKRIGNEILTDVTWYDPVAFAYPWHSIGIFQRQPLDHWKQSPPTINECATTNNVYHDENGVIQEFAPGDPRFHDLFDETPWLTTFTRSEEAKKAGRIPAAPSFLSFASR
jgi:hypothetical protein